MKLLIFHLGNQEYAITIENVLSIEKIGEIMNYSKNPYIDGLAEFRGRTSAVINLKAILTIQEDLQKVNNDNIILCDFKSEWLGLRVDGVRNLLDIEEESIQTIINQPEFVRGVFMEDDRAILLLDVEKLIQSIQ